MRIVEEGDDTPHKNLKKLSERGKETAQKDVQELLDELEVVKQ